MRMTKPPKEMLYDSFIYKEYQGKNSWGDDTFGEPVEVKHVRIQRASAYNVVGNGERLVYDSKVFLYGGVSDPHPTFKKQSVVIFDDKEHRIVNIDIFKEPYMDEVYSVELGLM